MQANNKKVVSADTTVETKSVPAGNDAIQRVTITTTKKVFSDGSTSTETETKTVTENFFKTTNVAVNEIRTIVGEHNSTTNQASHLRRPEEPNHLSHGDSSSDSSSENDDEDEDFSAFQRQALKAHNYFRKQHGAPLMVLSKKICQISQNWANTIAAKDKLEHGCNSGYGENVYWISNEIDNGKIPVGSWYDESKNYKFGKEGFQPRTGHFTQVIWKDSTELGIAKAEGKSGTFVVANYNPPGNFQGQYVQNVSMKV